MPHTTPRSVRRTLVILLSGALGCGSDILLPDPPGGGENVTLAKVKGDEQSGIVGEQLGSPLVVQVLTERQQPAPGRQVAFELADTAAGTVTPDTAMTNTQGEAVATWTLGSVPGPYVVVAHIVGLSAEDAAAEFRASASAGAPDSLRAETPLAQPGRRDEAVLTQPQVRVVDRFGNPVPGVPVSWQVTAGAGHVPTPITTTDAQGTATVEWTLGDRIGVHKLTAAIGNVAGSPVTFTATVLF